MEILSDRHYKAAVGETVTFALVSCLRSSFAFGRRCIPAGGVAPHSNIPDILTRRALPAGRLAALGATTNF